MSKELFQKRLEQIATDSGHIRNVCVQSQFAGGGLITDESERLAAIEAAAAESPMFEALGEHAGGVATAWGTAIHEYADRFGRMPSDEMLASAATSLRNITSGLRAGAGNSKMLESVQSSIETTEGQEFRARQAGLILPVMLMAATSDAATFIPAGANESEIFRIRRHAGTTFGDYNRGEELGEFSHGQYSQMDQIYAFPEDQQPDGTRKQYIYNASTSGPKIVVPFLKGSVKVSIDRREVATEAQAGKLFGTMKRGEVEFVVNGDVQYEKGIATITTNEPLPKGSRLHLSYDVDIEAKPELIPTIIHNITSVKLRPHQAVLAAEHTIQAYWMLNREFALDLKSMQMSQMRNYLAYEKDIKNLRKMIFAASVRETFDLTIPDGLSFRDHWEMLGRTLSSVSSRLMATTKVSGLVGMYCGVEAVATIKSLGAPHFVPVEGYRQVPRVHFVGVLFGMYRIFEVPVEIEAVKGDPSTKLGRWDCLCYARGESHTDAGLVLGDAVPATMYGHNTSKELRDRNTLWELSYCDIHPDNGAAFFSILSLLPAKAPAAPEAAAAPQAAE